MAKTGFLQYDNDNAFLPITRAELVKDSDGKCAFQSNDFLATPNTHGLLSHADKEKLDKMVGIHFIGEYENVPEDHFNISFVNIDDSRLENNDAFCITFPYYNGTDYGAQIAIDDYNDPTILVRGKSTDSEGEWGNWLRVVLENDSLKNPNPITIKRYEETVATYDGSVAKTVDITPIALSGPINITNAEIRDLNKFPNTYNLAVGWWAGDTSEDTCNFNTRYGTTLDLSYSTWYQRLAFNTENHNGKPRIEYFNGINTHNNAEAKADLNKVGDLAYLSDIPTYCANIPLKNESDDTTEAKFKSVTAQTYNVQNDDANTFTISYFIDEDSDHLEISKSSDQILLVNDSQIIPGNNDMTLGDSDHMWNSVYATTFVTTPNADSGFKPLCVTSEGDISPYTDSIGANDKPVYVKDGEIKAFTGDNGNATQGLYITGGKFTPMTYTLGAHISATSATSLGKLVLFDSNNTKLYPYSTQLGSGTQGIYINNQGIPAVMNHSLNASVQSGAENKLAYYSTEAIVEAFSLPVGSTSRPVWIEAGVPTPIALGASSETLYVTGWKGNTGGVNNAGLYTGHQSAIGVRIVGGNTVYAAGGFYESSDATLKTFGDDVKIDFNTLKKIPKKYFKWNSDKTEVTHLGTSAQELQKIYPELVKQDSDGHLVVAYDKLSVIALKAVDELYDMVKDLKASHDDLKARLELIEQQL